MSYHFIQTEAQFVEILTKQILPFHRSQENPIYCLDKETYSYYIEHSKDFALYHIPRPIKIPSRQVCRLWDKKEFEMEYESYSALLQLGANPRIYDKQWLFDVKSLGEDLIADGLREILETSTIIGHNLKYEAFFATTQYDIWFNPDKVRDLMLIEQIILAGTKDLVGLGDCYRRNLDYGFFFQETGKTFTEYLDHKGSMQESDWAGDLTPNQLQYGADDVRLPFYLYEVQKEKLKKFIKKYPKSTVSDIIKFECQSVVEDALVELRGIDFDKDYHAKEVIPYLENKKKESYERASALCPNLNPIKTKGRGALKVEYQEPLNFKSWQQVQRIMKELKIKVPDTTEDTLKKVRGKHPAVQAILNYRKCRTLLDNFGYKLPKFVHEDGRIHAEFRRIGTETGRKSSKNPNLYQIPKKEKLFFEMMAAELFRRLFVALSPYLLIGCDFATIEPRLLTQRSKDPNLIKAFNTNTDYYSFNAKNMLQLAELPAKGSHMREVIGKIGTLAVQYLAGDKRTAEFMLVETLDEEQPVVWTIEEAAEAKKNYFDGVPKVKELVQKTREEVWNHFAHFSSLAEFKGRKPIYVAFTDDASQKDYKGKLRRHRSWFLTDKQEELARRKVESGDPREHPLHKDYVTWEEVEYEDPVTGEVLSRLKKSNYNAFKKLQGEMIRELYNFRIQAPAAIILKHALKFLDYRVLREHGFDIWEEGIVLDVYDECVFRCHESKKELAVKLVQDAMIRAGEIYLDCVPVKAEAEVGSSWYKG